MLTGRYQFLTKDGYVILMVEEVSAVWRRATGEDLPELEPAIADGWRFPPERSGILLPDGTRSKKSEA